MRHRKSINQLGRKTAHRGAMLSNMAASLIMHKKINTTVAKAKSLREYVEPLITRSKEDTTHNRRMVFSYLQNKEAVTELFRNISQKIIDRPGGYTRILKTGSRAGDNADMCLIELVDYNETYQKESKSAAEKAKTRRSRSKKKAEDTVAAPVKEKTAAAVKTKEVVEEPVIIENTEEIITEEAEVRVDEAPVMEAPVEEAPVEEIPVDEVPEAGTPEAEGEETEKKE